MKKLYVVDVSSFFFRAFYAIPPLTSPDGMPTNALYGFLNMTIKLLREVKTDHIAFCFDRKDGSFRNEIYKDYKANRGEMPEDLIPQVPYVKELTDLLGIPRFEKKGFEADDVIGSLVVKGKSEGLDVVIVSGDKDFAQLIGPKVIMYDTMKSIKYDEEEAIKKWGVRPEQMIDYLALVGDSSDNVPGVRGIGPKGAQKLLGEYGTLEGIYQNIEDISAKGTKAKLQESEDMAYLSKELVTISTEVNLISDISELKLKEMKRDDLKEALNKLGFKSFEKSLLGKDEKNDSKSDVTESLEKSKNFGKKKTKKAKSSSAQFDEADIVIQQISTEDLKSKVAPFSEIWIWFHGGHLALGIGKDVYTFKDDFEKVGSSLERKVISWYGFDVKECWKKLNIKDQHCKWDSMLAAYVVRAGNTSDISKVMSSYLDFEIDDETSLAKFYSLHLELKKELENKLAEVAGEEIFTNMELPTVPVLCEMELDGIELDTLELAHQSESLKSDIEQIEARIHSMADQEFNVSSPKQLSKILFEDMGLTPGKKTKTGYSTNSDVLEKIKGEHDIVSEIINYRELTKLKSTYVDAIPKLINEDTGRIHTHFRQAVTSTGRLSSNDPNLQNIPIRTKRGRLIRKAFRAKSDSTFISVDYSQIELRVLAHITGDPGLMNAFMNDLDIHSATASEIFETPLDKVTSDLRRKAKAVNFGIAYGQGVYGLAETLGISRSESSEIISRYFEKFKNVKDYMETVVEQAKKAGYVETLFGRRRYIDELKSKNPALKKFGERAAINAPIQGTASDLVKMAMIELHKSISIPALLQVHDEVLFECPKDDVDIQISLIRPIMEEVYPLNVPLKVNVAVGENWDDAH